MDAKGNLHVLYFHGEAAGGDLDYVRRDTGKTEFSRPLQSIPKKEVLSPSARYEAAISPSAKMGVCMFPGMVHTEACQKIRLRAPPMLYARLNDQGTAFEPQRNLMTQSSILDGGGSGGGGRSW